MPAQISPAWPLLRWDWRGKQHEYTVTPTDREWFIRCLWREGKPAETVGHVLLQRFALLASTGAKYPTMTSFLRAYCQPVNPRWFPGGDLTWKAIKRAKAKGDSAAVKEHIERAKRRMIYSSTPISSIRSEFVQLADMILSGSSVSPSPRATHFTMSFAKAGDSESKALQAARNFAKKRGLTHVPIKEGQKRGLNWFFFGKILPPSIQFGTVSPRSATAFVLFPLGLFLFGWFLRRRREVDS